MLSQELYILLFSMTGVLSIIFALWVDFTYEGEGVKYFTFTFVLLGLWSINSTLRVFTSSIELTEYLLVSGAAIAFATAYFWLKFSLDYTGRQVFVGDNIEYIGPIFFFVILILGFTNSIHGLMWSSIEVVSGDFLTFNIQNGFGMILLIPTSIFMYLSGVYYMSELLLSKRHSVAAVLLTFGALSIVGINLVAFFLPLEVSYLLTLAPIGGVLMLMFTSIALNDDFLEITPVARTRILEEIGDAFVAVDTSGKISDFNKAFQKEFGGSRDIQGEYIQEVVPQVVEKLPDGGGSERIEISSQNKTRYYDIRASDVTVGANKIGRTYIFRDITERNETLMEVKRQNRHFEEFADSAAHELRNPISVLRGYSELLKKESRFSDDEKIVQYAEIIHNNAENMTEVATDFLRTIRSARSIDGMEEIQFESIIEDVYQNSQYANIQSLEVDEDGAIHADPARLYLMIEKIIETMNSRDNSNSISIVSYVTEDGFVLQDDGQEVPPDMSENVLDYGYTTRFRGKGLGLSVARTLAETHHWEIKISSDYEEGLRVIVEGVDTSVGESASIGATQLAPAGQFNEPQPQENIAKMED